MRLLRLRWVFLLAASAALLRCAFSGATPRRIAAATACWAAWVLLSRRKILSLDRANLGIPPRS